MNHTPLRRTLASTRQLLDHDRDLAPVRYRYRFQITKHLALGAAIALISALLGATALLYALTYLLMTAAAAASLLPNVGERIRHNARANSLYVCACALPIKAALDAIHRSSPDDLARLFGADISSTAHSIGTGILPTIYLITLASVPLAWTGWLVKLYTLHGRSDDFERALRRARREDHHQP